VWAEEVTEEVAVRRLREQLPDLADGRIEPIRSGWDSHAFVVEDTWIVRVPRRREAEESLRREAALLAAIAARLPSRTPEIERVTHESPICVLTRKIAGMPASGHPQTGAELGRFLAALHALPVECLPLPASDVLSWRVAHEHRRAQFERCVFPLLDPDERRRADDLFASVAFDFDPTLVHGDLGPEHVLCRNDGHIEGVIDWGDARIGDPAIDLAWALHGAGPTFADAVAVAYGGVPRNVRARATFYHRRGPWYEVLYGLEVGRTDLVASGLAGVRARLPPGV
jgi:aminoglycoside phosphotransferase (APT) family kinase protein